jgi:hypothetical protein
VARFIKNNNAGAQLVGQYYSYVEGTARNRAMSVPTISRARDLMASVIGCMNLKMYTEMWNGEEMEKMPLAPRTWLRRIDPTLPTVKFNVMDIRRPILFMVAHFGI